MSGDYERRGFKSGGRRSDSQYHPGKIFVGGISWQTTEQGMHSYFSRYGKLIDCVLMRDNKTGRPRGFGFVTFEDPSGACEGQACCGGPARAAAAAAARRGTILDAIGA